MKKNLLLIAGVVLILSLSLVSAGFWDWITGEAVSDEGEKVVLTLKMDVGGDEAIDKIFAFNNEVYKIKNINIGYHDVSFWLENLDRGDGDSCSLRDREGEEKCKILDPEVGHFNIILLSIEEKKKSWWSSKTELVATLEITDAEFIGDVYLVDDSNILGSLAQWLTDKNIGSNHHRSDEVDFDRGVLENRLTVVSRNNVVRVIMGRHFEHSDMERRMRDAGASSYGIENYLRTLDRVAFVCNTVDEFSDFEHEGDGSIPEKWEDLLCEVGTPSGEVTYEGVLEMLGNCEYVEITKPISTSCNKICLERGKTCAIGGFYMIDEGDFEWRMRNTYNCNFNVIALDGIIVCTCCSA